MASSEPGFLVRALTITNGGVDPGFQASDHAYDGKFHLLLCASGSVATIKLPQIVASLAEAFPTNLAIRLLLTKSAAHFLSGQGREQPKLPTKSLKPSFSATYIDRIWPNVVGAHYDEDEWDPAWRRGRAILHIELRRWADVMVVAPLSANTLGKIVSGICDNLLTSTIRAWQVEPPGYADERNPDQKLILVAPAMNTAMWRHPLTKQQLSYLGPGNMMHWFEVLWPIEKELACGDTGDGAMHDWQDIVERIKEEVAIRNSLKDSNGSNAYGSGTETPPKKS